MGSWFTNISVRKTEAVNADTFRDYWLKALGSKGYTLVEDESQADCSASIIAPADSDWITFTSDFITLESADAAAEVLTPLSAALNTAALAAACFDSDYVFLNIINASEHLDGWINVGRGGEYGIKRRTALSSWKNKVSDFEKFKAAAKSKDVFAEDALYSMAEYLGMPGDQAAADPSVSGADVRLFFRLPEGSASQELPMLVLPRVMSVSIPRMESYNTPGFINIGGASTGITVYFIGDFVEHDDITFDAWLLHHSVAYDDFGHERNAIPLNLEKHLLADGVWTYSATVSNYKIRERVPDALSEYQTEKEEVRREICVRYIPHGDGSKAKDICVAVAPAKNPAGFALWNEWRDVYNREAYLAHLKKIDDIKKALSSIAPKLPSTTALQLYMFYPKEMPPMEKESSITFLNRGSISRGLAIYIAGSFVENDEITFDVRLMRRSSYYPNYHHPSNSIPLEIHKQQLPNGDWVYAAAATDFQFLPRESEGLSENQIFTEKHKREITLCFTPHGRPTLKAMDICIIAMPIHNPEGYAVWHVLNEYYYGEKLASKTAQLEGIIKLLTSKNAEKPL